MSRLGQGVELYMKHYTFCRITGLKVIRQPGNIEVKCTKWWDSSVLVKKTFIKNWNSHVQQNRTVGTPWIVPAVTKAQTSTALLNDVVKMLQFKSDSGQGRDSQWSSQLRHPWWRKKLQWHKHTHVALDIFKSVINLGESCCSIFHCMYLYWHTGH